MADKKKPHSQSATRGTGRMAEVKTRSQVIKAGGNAKASSDTQAGGDVKDEKDVKEEQQSKTSARAAARGKDERKVQQSNQARRAGRSATWARWRNSRYARFILDAYYELRHKVTWPSFPEARNMTIAVIMISAAVGLVLGVVDLGLYNLFLLLSHIAK
jgi:preprotein translocase SecE subunit